MIDIYGNVMICPLAPKGKPWTLPDCVLDLCESCGMHIAVMARTPMTLRRVCVFCAIGIINTGRS
jgi:hypothetical protein